MDTLQPDAGPPVVPRIVAELNARPEERETLLRALLTEEFLNMPARLARIEDIVGASQGDMKIVQGDMKAVQGTVENLQGDMKAVQGITETLQDTTEALQGDMKTVQWDVKVLQDDVGWLKGNALESHFGSRAASILNREFGFLRCQVVHGQVATNSRHAEQFQERIEDAYENGAIASEQLQRILATDVIVRCRRPADAQTVWVVVEIAARLDANDIDRALQTAHALRVALGVHDNVMPVVAGERIDLPDQARARQAGVPFININARS